MQFIATHDGGEVAIMTAREVLVLESVLSRYVLKNPGFHLAVSLLREVEAANEARETRAEGVGQASV
ncbi:hypothetical protein ABZ370_08495 [Streptomyces sp. NPDC005962]|uniref:hypothetical protein n=1 Tax=Streptomyces sp. NPDC005962 TaxID=3154466 RepID=UPI0033D1B421